MASHDLEPVETASEPRLVSIDGRRYPLETAAVRTHAQGGIAFTTLTQTFSNPHAESLEVLYVLPLPADGAVLGYDIRIGERVIRGEIEPREKAEQRYRQALYEGKTTGLLEEDRADTFQQRLGNIPPGQTVTVEIRVLQPLAFAPGSEGNPARWEFRFPTVTGIRYHGAPGRVADTERLDPDRDADGGIPTRVTIEAVIGDSLTNPSAIDSPSHAIERDGDAEPNQVRLAQPARLDRDIVLRWPAGDRAVGVTVTEGTGLAGDDGRYALVTVTPPDAGHPALARDLTVLIDASGSMDGKPLALAKQIVTDLLSSLEPGDRFELLAFANQVKRLTRGLVKASPAEIERAIDALEELSAGGSTEMADALTEALEPLREHSQRQVVLVSDGYIGFEREVMRTVVERLPRGARVHTVGIGAAPNRTLTSGVARAGRGTEVLATERRSAADAARRLRAATARPVLTEIVIEGSALAASATARLSDVFTGRPLVFPVELRRDAGFLTVRGRLAGSTSEWTQRIEVPTHATESAGDAASVMPIGALFGREAIAEVEMVMMAGIAEGSIDEKVESLGMRHRIVSRRTSLVAISEEPAIDPNAPRRRQRLAVEVPFGVSAEGAGLGTMSLALASQVKSAGLIMRIHEPSKTLLSLDAMTERMSTPLIGRISSKVLEGTLRRLRAIRKMIDHRRLPREFTKQLRAALDDVERSMPPWSEFRRRLVDLGIEAERGADWGEVEELDGPDHDRLTDLIRATRDRIDSGGEAYDFGAEVDGLIVVLERMSQRRARALDSPTSRTSPPVRSRPT